MFGSIIKWTTYEIMALKEIPPERTFSLYLITHNFRTGYNDLND